MKDHHPSGGSREDDPIGALSARLVRAVHDSLERRDLEAHLVALVLHTGFRFANSKAFLCPWESAVAVLLSVDPIPPGPPRHPSDVAILGARLALGGGAGQASCYGDLARREVARSPLPPAACLRDDERLLLGVAAGIGVAAQDTAAFLIPVLRSREYTATLRQTCMDLWAEALAEGAPSFTPKIARRAYQHLTTRIAARAVTDEGRIAAFWIATRLLDAPWEPIDVQLAEIDHIIADGRRVAWTILLSESQLTPLDAALLLDGLIASPIHRLARQSALDNVITVIDSFPKSATVMAQRKRNRPVFHISDEYDVQDLFHALIVAFVPDIVDEDPAPKVAGHSTRLDFTSKSNRLGFEIKHVKSVAHVAKAREEILLDERTYQEHPYVDSVVVFLHDPQEFIPLHERVAFEADLSQVVAVAGRSVRYVVRVR